MRCEMNISESNPEQMFIIDSSLIYSKNNMTYQIWQIWWLNHQAETLSWIQMVIEPAGTAGTLGWKVNMGWRNQPVCSLKFHISWSIEWINMYCNIYHNCSITGQCRVCPRMFNLDMELCLVPILALVSWGTCNFAEFKWCCTSSV